MDYSMKEHVDPTAIAALIQRKAQQDNENQRLQQQDKFAQTQQIIQSAGGLVSTAIQASKAKQKEDMMKNLASSIAAKYAPNTIQPQLGPVANVMAPQGSVADRSSLFPNTSGQVAQEQAGAPLPDVSTPDYAGQNLIKQQYLSDPAPWNKRLAEDIMQTPQEKATMNMKNQTAAMDFSKAQNENAKLAKGNQPVSPATQRMIIAAHKKAGLETPDFTNMSEDRGQQVFNDALKLSAGDDKSLKLTEEQRQLDEKNMIKLDDRLNYGKSNRGANGQAAASLRGIGQLDALFKGYKDNLTPQEWEEASIAWSRILAAGGNGAARSQVEALVPKTARGNVKATMQWFNNEPTGTDQQKFAERMQIGMKREETYNTKYLKMDTKRALDGYVGTLSRRNPDDLQQLFQNKGLTYDDVKSVQPKLAAKAWPDGKPKEEEAPAVGKTSKPVDLGDGFSYTVN